MTANGLRLVEHQGMLPSLRKRGAHLCLCPCSLTSPHASPSHYIFTYTLTSDEGAPWFVERSLIPAKSEHCILPGKQSDVEFVLKLYQQCPVPRYDVKSVPERFALSASLNRF